MHPEPDATASDERVPLTQRLAEHTAAVLDELPLRVHPLWLQGLDGDTAALRNEPNTWCAALQAHFDLCWPDLSAAEHALELSWVLPTEHLHRLLAARALFAWRGTLARTLDAGLRRNARALLGSNTFDALVGLPQPRRKQQATEPLVPQEAVAAGWHWLERQLPWRDRRAHRLVALSLPPAQQQLRSVLLQSQDPATEHAEFGIAVNELFPEHVWLFGSKPATLKLA